MNLLETRDLNYVIVLAQELNFTRAAARLGMTQPPLSRAISRLERQLDVQLFVRTSRSVSITAAGAVFVSDAQAILDAMATSVNRVRAQEHARPIVVAVRPASASALMRGIRRQAQSSNDPLPITVELHRSPVTAVTRNLADAAVICTSLDTAGLCTEELGEQSTVALIPVEHPLAQRTSVTLADIHALSGYREDLGELSLDEIIDLVVFQGAAVLVSDDVTPQIGEMVQAVPVVDAPPTHLGLAYPNAQSHPRMAELITYARRAAYDYVNAGDRA